MEAEDEGFVEIEGKEKEGSDDEFNSPILVLLRGILEDSEKPWQRHLLTAFVPAWLALVTYIIWALASI